VSCQNEDLVTKGAGAVNAKIQLVQVTDNGQFIPVSDGARSVDAEASYALQFDSKMTYDAAIKQLETMSDEEKLAFAERYGLQSLQQLAVVADEELEQIGAEATSEADFRKKYEAYKEKYAGILITNPYDSSDLSLYVPDGDNVSTYLMNANGMVAIGDAVEIMQLKNEMSKSDKACFGLQKSNFVETMNYNEEWYTNDFSVSNYVKSKKLTFRIEIVGPGDGSTQIHIGAQKHMWYGWKRDDNRELYYTPRLSNMYYQGVVNGHLVPFPQAERYCHKGGKLEIVIGKKNVLSQPVTGTVLVWSDCIAEKDANGNFLYESKQILNGGKLETALVPKCLESSAFHVRVNLP
jgi:hypothetical protein